MRFEAEGPDIPLALLEARDRGEVVFLCGAGISIPAGMPNFRDLALQVVRDLGVPAADPASVLLKRALAEPDPALAPPMDQVFGVLQRDYGVARVEAAVAKLLRTKRSADLSTHRAVLRLSATADGVSRVITTNFDWLFERAEPGITWTAPPGLPDLAFGRALQGITYLHGRNYPPRRSRCDQAASVAMMVLNGLAPGVRRAVSITVRTSASPWAAHMAR